MPKYASKPNEKKSAKVYGGDLDISRKDSVILCKLLNNKSLGGGKKLLGNLVEQKTSLEGKYYTKTSKEILNLLNSAEKNAEFKGLDAKKLVVMASAHKGSFYLRPRRFRLRRQRKRLTNLQIALVEK